MGSRSGRSRRFLRIPRRSRGTGLFQKIGEFPLSTDPEHPIAEDAIDYYKNGPSYLNRYFPCLLYTSLVIADARLGHGSGVSAIEEILRAGFVPHLFITGNISRVKELRPDAVVLEKPFSETELMLSLIHI